MRQFQRTALSVAAAQVALLWSGTALAQSAPAPAAVASGAAAAKEAPKDDSVTTVVVTGQRAALASAQKIKQNADEIVDSIVAEDIGKLPDRSVTEVLQRVVGVTMDRTAARSDPVHYSVEGSGINIRGLTYVSSQLNGRETISANQGRNLGFEDVPPELMAGVDVYKNPSAEQIEGAIGGLVNLRTAMPFDFPGFKGGITASVTRSDLRGNNKPSLSGLLSNTWNTSVGKFGALVDIAMSKSSTRSDSLVVDPYYLATTTADGVTTVNTPERWVPRDMTWNTQLYDRRRDGLYGALQWKNDRTESSLTFFRSKYRFAMQQYSVSAQFDPYTSIISDDATYDANGIFQKGLLSSSSGGIEVETGTRYSARDSRTQDISWSLTSKVTDQWTLSSDLQLVKSNTSAFDSSVATAIMMPEEYMDLSGSLPRVSFTAADTAYLGDINNYYWATTMEHFDRGTATQKAWRGDAKYSFENNPVLGDVRFGARVADRSATTINSNPFYNWATITHQWQKGWNVPDMAYVKNYSDPVMLDTFSNFMGGTMTMPAMYVPAASVAMGWPNSYTSLHQHYKDLCSSYTDGNDHCSWNGGIQGNDWALATLGTDPSGTNDQHERTLTAYSQLRFDFDEMKLPLDGNIGLRFIHTDDKAKGYTILTAGAQPTDDSGVAVAKLTSFSVAQSFRNVYNDILPSLNLRLKARDDLQFRFAWSEGLSRPGLDQMQAYTTMAENVTLDQGTGAAKSVSYTGTASGNPMLRPIKSNQQDITAEWYFNKSGSLTFAAFNKNLHDIIVNQTLNVKVADDDGNPVNFVVTGPVNGAKGYARGFEAAYRQYFDFLPEFLRGIGLEANYTFVNSKMKRYNAVYSAYCSPGAGQSNLNLYINGCDTDGRTFGDTPLPNLSRNTFNIALLYDRGPVSARLAYSWRERYLYGVALNSDATGPNQTNGLDTNPDSATYGTHTLPIGLPLWADSYGQLDGGVHLKVSEGLTLGLEGQNLTNAMYRQLMQQHIGMMNHNYFTSGRRWAASASYSF
jgi:iron complex outermembrane receptor protein